jgi:hypothetical protein
LLGLEFDMKKLKQDVAILKANKKKGKDNNDTESDEAEEMFEKQFPLATIDDFDALETSISSAASKRALLVSRLIYHFPDFKLLTYYLLNFRRQY